MSRQRNERIQGLKTSAWLALTMGLAMAAPSVQAQPRDGFLGQGDAPVAPAEVPVEAAAAVDLDEVVVWEFLKFQAVAEDGSLAQEATLGNSFAAGQRVQATVTVNLHVGRTVDEIPGPVTFVLGAGADAQRVPMQRGEVLVESAQDDDFGGEDFSGGESLLPPDEDQFVPLADAAPAEGEAVRQRVEFTAVFTMPGEAGPEGKTYTLLSSTANGDARSFDRALQAAGGRGDLPTTRVGPADQGSIHGNLDDDIGAAAFLGGGASDLSYRVEGLAEDLSGSLFADRSADWIYYSGHYVCGSGGAFGAQPNTAQTRWEDVEVVVFASCNAVDVAWQEDQLHQFGAGTDGRRWWEKFRGTLLGYRTVAPSGGASAVAQRFVSLAATSLSGGARPAEVEGVAGSDRSVRIAWAWMRANLATSAIHASAFTDAGDFLYIEGGRIRLKARAGAGGWQAGSDRIALRDGVSRSLTDALRVEFGSGVNGRPPTLDQILASRSLADTLASEDGTRLATLLAESGEIPEASPAALQAWLMSELRTWRGYQLHVYFETDLRPDPQEAAEAFTQQQGRAPTLAELRAVYTPTADERQALADWRRESGRGGAVSIVQPDEAALQAAAGGPSAE